MQERKNLLILASFLKRNEPKNWKFRKLNFYDKGS